MDIKNLTSKQAHELLINKKMSVLELLEAVLKEAEATRGLNAYLEIFSDVRVQAEVSQNMITEGRATKLTGIPCAMKDNILIRGRIASASSKMLENYTATYDAHVTKKLRDAGAVFIGRTNMDEFAMGGSTENSAFGATKNPHDKTRVPGGSSGGSAAALAANAALASLGFDRGGSIRQPAAFCGVVGLKPTYGSVSRSGLIAMASSLDQIGPFAKSVEDPKTVFDVIKGRDALDSTTISPPKSDFGEEVGLRRIGLPKEYFGKGLDPEVEKAVRAAIKKLEEAGHAVKEISLPMSEYALAAYYIIMPAEVS